MRRHAVLGRFDASLTHLALLNQRLRQRDILLQDFGKHGRVGVQVAATIVATATEATLGLRSEPRWRYDDLLLEELLVAHRICLVWLVTVEAPIHQLEQLFFCGP